MNQYETALKFQTRALRLAEETGDVASQGRAYGNMGNAYSASGLYEQVRLGIFKRVLPYMNFVVTCRYALHMLLK